MEKSYIVYKVWDLPVRLFHWINFLCIIGLIALGTMILYHRDLGLSDEGEALVQTIHVYVGYIFAINLFVRLIWAFAGNRFSRWNNLIPIGSGYFLKLKNYLSAAREGKHLLYLGHNPLGQLAVFAIMIALLAMVVSGLLMAGTDLYMPPFGSYFQKWVAATGVNPSDVVAHVRDNVDETAFAEMRAFRRPFSTVHVWTYYIIIGLVILHIGAVIYTEVKSGANLISAMFTGKKILPGEAEDED
ncbi:MAG: cytochrome b/b6 domain-containing protein [Alphaproteobacteria bacterium]|nr:cytochrome b/b6 domain-containing protein [Alphaproteobacteria bacterium]HPF45231.1 cytochrome b/b6 domain-containing protein [Emcibacteraceae bacterium]HRW30725.1 cytochrome b/b6 domain-containing protein [Emcibacteraceae bacterium]